MDRSALVIGSSGGIGAALLAELEARQTHQAIGFSRYTAVPLDLLDEGTIKAAAQHVRETLPAPSLIIIATGFLHGSGYTPEKAIRALDADHLVHAYRINAVGPALVMKHFLPLLPRKEQSVFAVVTAKVGSIADNRLGGWYSYRASKAAANQLVKTASIELARKNPSAACVAVHPGTVDTGLSQPFARSGLTVQTPQECARNILTVLSDLSGEETGQFLSYSGEVLPW